MTEVDLEPLTDAIARIRTAMENQRERAFELDEAMELTGLPKQTLLLFMGDDLITIDDVAMIEALLDHLQGLPDWRNRYRGGRGYEGQEWP